MVGAGIDSILEMILLIYWRSYRLYSTYWWVFKYPLLRLPHATCVSKQWESDKYGPFRSPCRQSSAMVTTIQSPAACEGEQRISLGGIAGERCLNINCDSSWKSHICNSCDISFIQSLSRWCSLVNMMVSKFNFIYIIFLFIYFASNWATQREKRELIHTNKDYHQLTQGNPAGNCKRGISSPPSLY